MFLLDTNVISETRKPRPNDGLAAWVKAVQTEALFLSVMTLGEIRKGIERLRARDDQTATQIESWLTDLAHAFGPRLLSVDQDIADSWGRIAAEAGYDHLDTILAATARVHGLTLVTRNTRHVDGLGIRVLNPFSH